VEEEIEKGKRRMRRKWKRITIRKRRKKKTVTNRKRRVLPDTLCLNGTFTLLFCGIKRTHCFN
jgi:hypothetical protein